MNNILNIFSAAHKLHAYRWLIVTIIISAGLMCYFDYAGDGIFMNSQQSQQWRPGGAGYHK